MNEMMELILKEIQKINVRLDNIDVRLDRLETKVDKLEDNIMAGLNEVVVAVSEHVTNELSSLNEEIHTKEVMEFTNYKEIIRIKAHLNMK